MDCLLLHSTECVTLLEGAYQKLQQEEKVEEEQPLARALATFEFFADGDDSSSDDGKQRDSDEEGGSSSSSEDESVNDKEKESLPTVSETVTSSPPLAPAAPASLENTNNSQPSKISRKDPKQRQREQDVKRHAQKLQRTSFCYEDKSDMAIHVPTSLLPPRQSKSKQCCHILQVAKSLAALKPVVVLLLRSGRFAAAIYQQEKCLHHTTSTRYTVRKGQGKAQSSQDGQRRPKSMGSQLRRAGEQQLKEDVHSTLRQWKSHIDQSALILISCPKTMRSTLFENMEGGGLDKTDPRLVSIPFDVGRPSFEGAGIVYEALMTVSIGLFVEKEAESESRSVAEDKEKLPKTPTDTEPIALQEAKKEPDIIPLTKLHEASRDANLTLLLDLLRDPVTNMVDQPAGYDFMTPLHFASESTADPTMAAACISALLIQGHANPRMVDARNRVPYFLAHHDKAREAFRKARAVLGEESCDWDAAQVGPPLTEDDIQAKKEKEAEKKRRKKQKQKEKKMKEKAQAEEMQQRRKQAEEEEKQAEDAKRVRDALDPKTVRKDNVCDFCQTEVKGRKRQQMFKRLDYNYCSSECVQKHKRELMAKAAMERFK